MSIFVEILVRIASYGLQIDQSHGEIRLSHIINVFIFPFQMSEKQIEICEFEMDLKNFLFAL